MPALDSGFALSARPGMTGDYRIFCQRPRVKSGSPASGAASNRSSKPRRALRPEVSGKLSPAAYETLAIVAFQQPVTRSRIEEVRGVNCDSVLTNLELRDLIVEVGRGSGPGQPKLYGTTMRFLQVMGLESLDHLPKPRFDPEELERSKSARSLTKNA